MKKSIVLSLVMIVAVAAVVAGATGAFFGDTETSTGNTFTAGAIDLLVDNTCYYNGQACTNGFWGGIDEVGNECACTWELSSLDGKVFFNLNDLKPGDTEEDTISLHVKNNPAWACAKITMTSNEENGCSEPEAKAEGGDCTEPGELPGELQFVWWADDGDNVLEADEAAKIDGGGGVMGTFDWMMNEETPYFGDKPGEMLLTLSDSVHNFFNPGQIAPLDGETTYYIGKAFCFGNLTLAPVAEDQGVNPTVDSGVLCDGKPVGNASQTDKMTANLEFYVEQARNNDGFLCPEHVQPEG